ncbi:MAG: lipoate--protein ligase family protein [Bacilli bacterium]
MADKPLFRLLNTGRASGAFNMALDEAILMQVAKGESLPTIRFYAWNAPTISIGYFQRIDRDIDSEKVRSRGFDIVRRMTGGRAVLHDSELTYSVMAPGDHPFARSSVVESYRLLSLGLRKGFINLGVHAEVVSLAEESERAKFATLGSAACFDSPSWYELVVEGKKIAGSAQVRAHGGLLQHGALLLDLEPDDLFDVLLFRDDRERERIRAEFDLRAVSVKQLTGRTVSYEEAAAAFADGFSEGLEVSLIPMNPTDQELTAAHVLLEQKYSQDAWTRRR